ncbi:MAG: Linearmycin resistance ATP-binding protein LnrL [Chlamydiia bacterium]|nr:Linearmycin resistance ATP-binding protein LnrL [Chlamydiia bacterium]
MSETLIEIKNVSKVYQMKGKRIKEALKKVSLNINKQEVFGLLGVNGAGKTTLSSILASLHPPTNGDVLYQGKTIYKQLVPYRAIIGFCPQKPNLDASLTVEETLVLAGECFGLSRNEAKQRKDEVISKLTLDSYAKSVTGQLSGGYKQRFLIGRAIMHKPKLVILDEPTVGLDPHIRHQLWDVIRELRTEGTSVLLTTHYLDEAEALSDRVCFIHQGEIKVISTPEKLLASYQAKNLEDVFLQFVDESEAEVFSTKKEEASV